MASSAHARKLDIIDTRPSFTAADAAAYQARFRGVPTASMLRRLIEGGELGQLGVVSSFGTESAVLLHLVASIDPGVPVLFVDTGRMFAETLAYRDTLQALLGLTDVRTIHPVPETVAAKDANQLRWSFDPDGCCAIRKTEPLARALTGFDAWISGRKAFQASTRATLPRFELADGRLKVNPLADWTKADLDLYFADHDLPRHPLEAQNYASIGCAPCTSPVQPGEDPRAGRWRGWDKTECGIHVSPIDGPDPNEPAF